MIYYIFFISLLVHMITPFFSTGFQHYDEYFQIAEFLNAKLNGINAATLSWEHQEAVRPWFQIGVVYLWIKGVISGLFGITSPFSMMSSMRLLFSLISFSGVWVFLWGVRSFFKEECYFRWTALLLNFTWFIPYIHARSSGENFSQALLMMGLGLFFHFRKNVNFRFLFTPHFGLFLSGLLIGLAYQARFQLSIPIACFWFSLFLPQNRFPELKLHFILALGILLGILVGFPIDHWGYGYWNFTVYNYFEQNFLVNRLGTQGNHYPVWTYLQWAFLQGIPPISWALIIGVIVFWKRFLTHPMTWITLPLFLFHSFINHKELRYLFPLFVMAPFLMMMVLQEYDLKNKLKQMSSLRFLHYLFMISNVIFLVVVIFRPANSSENFFKSVSEKQVSQFCSIGLSPYKMVFLAVKFLNPQNTEVIEAENITECLLKSGRSGYIFAGNGNDTLALYTNPSCHLEVATHPQWFLNLPNISHWKERSRLWGLFLCNKG